MEGKVAKQINSTYLRLQGNRCQLLSRGCMDLGTARDLRLMAEEYFIDAAILEEKVSDLGQH
jgi:hypothetical protein